MPLLIQLLLLLFPMVIGKVRGRPASRDFSKPSTVQEVTFVLPQDFIQVFGSPVSLSLTLPFGTSGPT